MTDLRRRNSHPPKGSCRLGGETTEELAAAAPLVGLEPLCVAWEICSSKGKSEKEVEAPRQAEELLGDPLQEGSLSLPTGLFLTRRCTLKGHLINLRSLEMHSTHPEGLKRTSLYLLMNCDVVSFKRARSFGQHRISVEDAPGLLDFLKRDYV